MACKMCVVIFLIILIGVPEFMSQPCPDSCEDVACVTDLTQAQCPDKYFLEENGGICNCCPGCKTGVALEGNCNNYTEIRKCAPGLVCLSGNCALNKNICSHTYHLTQLSILPTCGPENTYAAKQCKGDRISGRCFCYNEVGQRIFGWDWWNNADDMTCACSRRRHELETTGGRIDVTLHCDQNGNYEELQCDSSICWCAEPKTGQIQNGTRAVPEKLWQLLPCYSSGMGIQYLRQCESAAYAQNVIRDALTKRGTLDIAFVNMQCDYDGSYGTYTIDKGIANCMWRDSTRIGSYAVSSLSVSEMNCYCARDLMHFEAAGLTMTLMCQGNGNYQTMQDINGRVFCVDNDGFAVSGYFNSTAGLDCDQYLYYKI